jgi:chorismate mutase / prephenate dehydratase
MTEFADSKQNSGPSGPNGLSLADVRRTIDGLDDQMLQLLEQRFALVEQVRALKAGGAAGAGSALRPAREAQVLRRLTAHASHVTPDLLVRLWQAIFCAASVKQGTSVIHVSEALRSDFALGLAVHDAFPMMAFEPHAEVADVVGALQNGSQDLAVVTVDEPWADLLIQGRGGKASVVAVLPPLESDTHPGLLVIAHSNTEPSGKDETIIACNGSLPREFPVKPNWQSESGGHHIVGLPGFLSERDAPLHAIIRANARLGIKVLGRYPIPVTV